MNTPDKEVLHSEVSKLLTTLYALEHRGFLGLNTSHIYSATKVLKQVEDFFKTPAEPDWIKSSVFDIENSTWPDIGTAVLILTGSEVVEAVYSHEEDGTECGACYWLNEQSGMTFTIDEVHWWMRKPTLPINHQENQLPF